MANNYPKILIVSNEWEAELRFEVKEYIVEIWLNTSF